MSRLVVPLLLCTASLMAQPSPKPASISGIVRDSASKLPLEGVRVNVEGERAVTDANGRFRIVPVEPGRHWMMVGDERRAAWGGAYVLVHPSEAVENADVLLRTGGAIAGRVLDDNREPVSGVAVVLLEPRWAGGEIAYLPHRSATTDQTGAYRLEPVPSGGNFLLLAKTRFQVTESARPVLLPVFYPNADHAEGAQSLRLSPGELRTGIDIRVRVSNTYCISGTVEGAKVNQVNLSEQLSLADHVTFAAAPLPVSAEGTFRACGLYPGEYKISGRQGSQRLLARISVGKRDLEDLRLSFQPPLDIPGESSWEGAPADPKNVTMQIMLEQRFTAATAEDTGAGAGISGGLARGERAVAGESFTLSGIPMEDHHLRVTLPDGCYVKSATYGSSEIHGDTLRLTRLGAGRLHLGLACDTGGIEARVTDREGNSISNVQLFLLPVDAAPGELPLRMRVLDLESGQRTLTGLRPGKYIALAGGLEIDDTVGTIQRIWNVRSRGKEVEITPSHSTKLTLEAIEIE